MSESDPTDVELLTAVNAAILSLVTGKIKSYSIGDRSFTRYDLAELRTLRDVLKSNVAAVSRGSNIIRLADMRGGT